MTPEDGSQPDTAKAAPGWYPDPEHEDQDRYWHGAYWTNQRRPRQPHGRPPTPHPDKEPGQVGRGLRRMRGELQDALALQKVAPIARSKAKDARKKQRAERSEAERRERQARLEQYRAEWQ